MPKFKFGIRTSGFEKGRMMTKKNIQKILMKSMFKMEELAIEYAPHDQGDLRIKITVFPEVLASKYVLTSRAPHSAAMEYGTRPFYAPIKPLKEWAGRKLGDSSIGYAVRAKIAAEGITAQPYMRPALSIVRSFWLPNFYKEVFVEGSI